MMEMSRGAEKENGKLERVLLKQRYQPKSTGEKENVKTIIDFPISFVLPILTANILKLFLLWTWPYQDSFYIQPSAEVNYWSCLYKQ